MSVKYITWVLELGDDRLTPAHAMVLIVLADRANHEGVCWPGQASISRAAKMSERTARDKLADLEAWGFVSRRQRPGDGTGRLTTVYALCPECPDEAFEATGESRRLEATGNARRLGQPANLAGATGKIRRGNRQTSADKPLEEPSEEPSLSLVPSPAAPTAVAVRPDVADLLDELDALVIANEHKPTGHTKAARDAMRLLIDLDGRSPDDIRAVMRWATADPFWRANIRSAPALRERWGTLRSRMSTPTTSPLRRTPAQRAEQSMRAMIGHPALAGLEAR